MVDPDVRQDFSNRTISKRGLWMH